MAHRIEVASSIPDTRVSVLLEKLIRVAPINDFHIIDVYTPDLTLNKVQLQSVANMLRNPVTEIVSTKKPFKPYSFTWAIEIGFLPGVTDNIGTTVSESIEDLLNLKGNVYSSQLLFFEGQISKDHIEEMGRTLANPLIQRISIKNYSEFMQDGGMGITVPVVKLTTSRTSIVDLLNADEQTLTKIGKEGIENKDRSRRGPLALDLTYMKTIQNYFNNINRNPTDIELESIAQTWSEHCKHTIFADPIDHITDGLYKTFIKGATNQIRKNKGNKDFCISVFTDNSGGIIFDQDWVVTDKAETHNSPSALDPFGGAITGIVGVNRDTMGYGLGAKPIMNRYGFCFADPNDSSPLYKGKNKTQKMLSPLQIMEGVIEGVNVGGNCSGIPTTTGFMNFDPRYKGKPLVFVGTLGIIPRISAGRLSHEKKAQVGDYIVVVGGRVGKDGIHGATFSSVVLNEASPATAVQIGNPITQKKMSDVIIKEVRDLNLYSSITDNGAGGLSCSVAEMAKECGGCDVNLEDVPVKYPGLAPWEIWISESQERMTLSIPPQKWDQFSELMERRGVEATVIGTFTDSGKCVVNYQQKNVMDLEMDFLHEGLPKRAMTTTYVKPKHHEPNLPLPKNLTPSLHQMLKRLNITSHEFVSQQYDHEVQGGSVIKPLQGKGRVNGDAAVTRPLLHSQKAIVTSQGINARYSDIDTYHMAAAAIDTAIRNAIVTGAPLDHLALMDNFCWCSSDDEQRLGELKEAVKACYDTAVAFGTPFISGKDSMFNDFEGFDEDGDSIKISVPPTLLISSLGVMEDARKAISLDAKFEGDLIYVLGETHDELGGSEYFAMHDVIGNCVPKVDTQKNKKLYSSITQLIDEELIASAQSVHHGGLAVALAKTSMGGKLGLDVSIEHLAGDVSRDDYALYSETQGRVIVSLDPKNQETFELLLGDNAFTKIGTIGGENFIIRGKEGKIVDSKVQSILNSYKETFSQW